MMFSVVLVTMVVSAARSTTVAVEHDEPVAVGRVEDRNGQRADHAVTEGAADDVLAARVGRVALVEDDHRFGAGGLAR